MMKMRMNNTDAEMTEQRQQTSSSPVWSLLRKSLSLKFSLLRRSDQARRLQLIETLPLGGKRQLMLVTCDGADYLIGLSADGVQTIHPTSTVVTDAGLVTSEQT